MQLHVQVQTGQKRDSISWDGESLLVRIVGELRDGEANIYLEDYLANVLEIRRNQIRVVQGFTSASKTLETNLTEDLLNKKLTAINFIPPQQALL